MTTFSANPVLVASAAPVSGPARAHASRRSQREESSAPADGNRFAKLLKGPGHADAVPPTGLPDGAASAVSATPAASIDMSGAGSPAAMAVTATATATATEASGLAAGDKSSVADRAAPADGGTDAASLAAWLQQMGMLMAPPPPPPPADSASSAGRLGFGKAEPGADDGTAPAAGAGRDRLTRHLPGLARLGGEPAEASAQAGSALAGSAADRASGEHRAGNDFSALLGDAAQSAQAMQAAAHSQAPGAQTLFAPTATPPTEATVPVPVADPAFGSVVMSQVVQLAGDGVQEARLHLNPAEMGPIVVRIAISAGEARVQFDAAHAATRSLLEGSLPTLAQAFQADGLTLAGCSVQALAPPDVPPAGAMDGSGRAGADAGASFNSNGSADQGGAGQAATAWSRWAGGAVARGAGSLAADLALSPVARRSRLPGQLDLYA